MNDHCKVYLNAQYPHGDLIALVSGLTQGSVERRTITTPTLELDVMENDNFAERTGSHAADAFLFYRYYLDMFPRSGVPQAEYIGAVHQLMTQLRGTGLTVVASCDFEHLLAPG